MGPLELMILTLCIGGYECNKAPTAYYLGNKDMQTWVKKTENRAKEYVKESSWAPAIPYLAPFVLISSGGSATIKITKHTSVKIAADELTFKLTYVF